MSRRFPWFVQDLIAHPPRVADLPASLAVALLGVPQGIAYAMIAGLPPASGLWAAAVPAIVGSLLRSSRHVVAGPTNALSLLVGTAILASGGDPVTVALQLALMVGLIQVVAGSFRLGALVDYVSGAVVLGYITGAAGLILVGQLPNATGSRAARGHLVEQVVGWIGGLDQADPLSITVAVGVIAVVVIGRRVAPAAPGSVIALVLAIAASWGFDLHGRGVRITSDLASIPAAFPPFGWPGLSLAPQLVSVAVAATVLSFVESSSVARATAGRSGDRLDMNGELFGQGVANVAAGLTGGYPVSGSLSRSALNVSSGAASRVAGALSGVWIIVVMVFGGPVLDLTPIPALAGLVAVVAWDLLDVPRLRATWTATSGDRFALVGTLIGTFTLPLDQAIYLGVVLSLVLFLRRARLVHDAEMRVDAAGRLHAFDRDDEDAPLPCGAVRILHVEGDLFFGAAAELESDLDRASSAPGTKVLIVRMKRAHNLDMTSAEVLVRVSTRMRKQGRRLLLVGLKTSEMALLTRTGLADQLGPETLHPTHSRWFVSMQHAVEQALEFVGPHDDPGDTCPLEDWLAHRRAEERGAVG